MRPNSVLVATFACVVAVGSATAAGGPTFSGEVAPILVKNCLKCHQPGEIASAAPFLSYDTVRPWAKAIKEKVLTREMPPWPAGPDGKLSFRNDARLSSKEIETLAAWVDAGAPRGNDSDLLTIARSGGGWLHPQGLPPDLVIAAPEFEVPAKGEVPYVKYLSRVPFMEDKWIVAAQARPGNRAVVHHMAITEIAVDDGLTAANLGPITQLLRQLGSPNEMAGTRAAVTAPGDPAVYDMLGLYTPGSTFEIYPAGSAKLLKAGKNLYINFNIHYQTTGKPEKDRPTIAFWFLPHPPDFQMYRVPGAAGTIIANGRELLLDTPGKKAEGTSAVIPPIPPHADNYELTGVTAYTQPVTLYQFQPHAHLRAKDFKYAVVYPDGREETLLSIPKFDFRWQLAYELNTPLTLPPGSKLVVTAHYDNSAGNEHNPGADNEVHFREGQNQSWDEMFTPFIQYTMNRRPINPAGADLPLSQVSTTSPKELSGHDVVEIAEVVGCLEQRPSGEWMLIHAGFPMVSKTQSTSAMSIKAAEMEPLRDQRYSLLGVTVFNPSGHRGEKTVVKGALINEGETKRLNVTSLQQLRGSSGDCGSAERRLSRVHS
jgi:hypothetical protein